MPAIWTVAGGTWPLPTGWNGSTLNTPGSIIAPISWIDCLEGESIINGTISTVWDSNPQRCQQVTHSVVPSLPIGITITDDPDGVHGIIVTGLSTTVFVIPIVNDYTDIHGNKGTEYSNSLPINTMLTHYHPISTEYIDYSITVIVKWEHDSGNVDSDSKTFILRMWNNWVVDRDSVKKLAGSEVKGV